MRITKAQLLAQLRKLKTAALEPDPTLDVQLDMLGFPIDGKAELELVGLIEKLEKKIKEKNDDL